MASHYKDHEELSLEAKPFAAGPHTGIRVRRRLHRLPELSRKSTEPVTIDVTVISCNGIALLHGERGLRGEADNGHG